MNCNDDTPCEYECGRWGSHTRPKLGYVCSDERKPACMWGGYCYDVFKSPATRPLYYAWTTAFWVAVGSLGWAALILLCGVVLNKSPDADATTNAKGIIRRAAIRRGERGALRHHHAVTSDSSVVVHGASAISCSCSGGGGELGDAQVDKTPLELMVVARRGQIGRLAARRVLEGR